jgi:hypothetical protein
MKVTLAQLCIAACFFCSLGASTPPTTAPATSTALSNKLTLTGTLSTGIVAIGGETTGIEFTSGGVKYELEIKDAATKKKAEELNGKNATVTGTLTLRQGVERGQRRIITVESLAAK